MTPPLTTSQVARRLGCSEATVRRLDSVLAPTKTATGLRLYEPEAVERVAAERAAR
jgi:DNA-binding transcriptional MerR regulator